MAPTRAVSGFTPRRRAIAVLLAEGLDYVRIAGRLRISRDTVSKHVEAMRRRYQATNNTHLVGIPIHLGEVAPPLLPEGVRSVTPPSAGAERGTSSGAA